MGILLITEIFPPRVGGSGRWLWEIYRRLPRVDVAIAAGEDPRQGEFDQGHDLRVERIPMDLSGLGYFDPRGFRAYRRALRRVRAVIESEGIRQLHCARCVPEGWVAWLLNRSLDLPYVCYAHGEEVNRSPVGPPTGIMTSRQLRWMAGVVLRGARFTIANCRNTARILTRQWSLTEERIRLLYPGVDTHLFVPAARDPEVRARLGWGDRPVILTAGRLQQRKGHDRMIRALHGVRRTVPDVLYAIVGDGPERQALHDLVAREGLGAHVRFHGEANDRVLIQCYQQCDLFVLPNRQIGSDLEGFGIVLLEAQACGKPVIAGASGGTMETMRAPETGRVIPCDDPRELMEPVIELLTNDDRRARMGASARRWAVERFDWDSLSDQAQRHFAEVGPRDGTGTGPDLGRRPVLTARGEEPA